MERAERRRLDEYRATEGQPGRQPKYESGLRAPEESHEMRRGRAQSQCTYEEAGDQPAPSSAPTDGDLQAHGIDPGKRRAHRRARQRGQHSIGGHEQ